jgi:hypothetical protein
MLSLPKSLSCQMVGAEEVQRERKNNNYIYIYIYMKKNNNEKMA